MNFSLLSSYELFVLVFLVAALYSSVGHGGASGYLAVLSFFSVSSEQMASTALVLNILVASVALFFYGRARYFSMSLSLPLVAASVPAAFLGGLIPLKEKVYLLLLALVLVLAALRLFFVGQARPEEHREQSPKAMLLIPSSAGIGFLSGIVGVGGGIFLSPLMIFLKWGDVKTTAATSAFFIVVNSLAGIAGRVARGGFRVEHLEFLLLAGLLGSLLGSYCGAYKLPQTVLKRLLAIALLIASFKMLFQVYF